MPGDEGKEELGLTVNRHGFLWGVMEMFWNQTVVMVAQHRKYNKTTEVYTLTCLILCYAKYISISKYYLKKRKHDKHRTKEITTLLTVSQEVLVWKTSPQTCRAGGEGGGHFETRES